MRSIIPAIIVIVAMTRVGTPIKSNDNQADLDSLSSKEAKKVCRARIVSNNVIIPVA
jgi:hypothetical protein